MARPGSSGVSGGLHTIVTLLGTFALPARPTSPRRLAIPRRIRFSGSRLVSGGPTFSGSVWASRGLPRRLAFPRAVGAFPQGVGAFTQGVGAFPPGRWSAFPAGVAFPRRWGFRGGGVSKGVGFPWRWGFRGSGVSVEVGFPWRWGCRGGGVAVEVGFPWRWGFRGGGVSVEVGFPWKWGFRGSGVSVEVGFPWKWGFRGGAFARTSASEMACQKASAVRWGFATKGPRGPLSRGVASSRLALYARRAISVEGRATPRRPALTSRSVASSQEEPKSFDSDEGSIQWGHFSPRSRAFPRRRLGGGWNVGGGGPPFG